MFMTDLQISHVQFDAHGYWHTPISEDLIPEPDWVHLFDQNGYDLSPVEIMYSEVNGHNHSFHRNSTHWALKSEWFTQPTKTVGAVINHALIFERKGYAGEALAQLEAWAEHMPLLYKVARLRPKWGLDFSMDWADRSGNVFEIFHYEFDSFDYDEIESLKQKLEPKFLSIDWEAAALELLRRKSEWHHLGFFEQSDYKCAFFGLPSERFKMVAWS